MFLVSMCLYCRRPPPYPHAERENSSSFSGTSQAMFFLHGCVKQSSIFHICHHDNQGNARFGPSHSQTVVRTPGLRKHNTSCPSYSQTAFHPWLCAWHSHGFKTVQRMTGQNVTKVGRLALVALCHGRDERYQPFGGVKSG